jgi:hypothetical protein
LIPDIDFNLLQTKTNITLLEKFTYEEQLINDLFVVNGGMKQLIAFPVGNVQTINLLLSVKTNTVQKPSLFCNLPANFIAIIDENLLAIE